MNLHGRTATGFALACVLAATGCPLTASDDYAVGAGGAGRGGASQGAGSSTGGAGTGASGAAGGASGGQGGQGTGGAAPIGDLVSDGLVARWFVDEASSGQAPTALVDGTSNPMNVDLVYTDYMSFSESGGNRGLSWSAAGVDGAARVPADGTKAYAAIDGATQLTVELVVASSGVVDAGTRFVSIGTDMEWEPFAVLARSTNAIDFRMNSTDRSARWSVDLGDGQRRVFHFVVDTSAADQTDRIVAFIDGAPGNRIDGNSPGQGEAFALGSGRTFLIGNREGGSRSVQGTIYYVALYDRAMSVAEVENNATALEAFDDTPN